MGDAFLSQVRLDGGTQMRADLSQATVQEYAEHIRDGVQFPPVVVFYDGHNYWLADGFHRYHAFKQAKKDRIPCDVRSGDKIEAIRYALKANATNGRPRTREDMRRGYQVAISNKLCEPDDAKAVRELLGCSVRWATELTRDAREDKKSERNERINELAAEGKSQREIAAEVGVGKATVADVTSGRKKQSAKSDQTPKAEPVRPTKKPKAKRGKSEAPKVIEALKNLSSCIQTANEVYRSATDKQRAEIRGEFQRALLFMENLSEEIANES